MAEDFDYEFSENLDSYFIVADSQEDQDTTFNKNKLMETLSALSSSKANRKCELDVPYSPRRCDLPQSASNSKSRKAATSGNAGTDNDQQPQGDAPQQGSGDGEGGSAGGGGGGGGGDPGGGGHDGGDGGSGGEHPGEGGEEEGEETEEEEQHAEESTPSASGGSGNSVGAVPPLIAAQAGQHAAPHGVPEHLAFQQIHEPPSNGHVVQAGDSSHSGSAQGSWGEGGISDAPTAPVMDSDQDVTTPADHSGSHLSPGDPGLSPRVHDISSTHSVLSSLTSSSSDPQSTLRSMQRKRPPTRRIHQQSKKQKLLDVSTTDTSGRDTSTSKTDTTTTTTTTTDTSRDESRSQHEGPGDHTHDDNIEGSQEDLFEDNNNAQGPGRVGGSRGHNTGGPAAGDVLMTGLITATPAEKLESLQFSGQPMLVPETETCDGSPEEIPPSQGVFGSQTPRMIPSSPTALVSNMPTASQYEDADDEISAEKKSTEQSRPKSVHEWQPSYPGFESSSRSRTASVQVNPGSSGSLESRPADNGQRSKVVRKGSKLEEPIESQDVQIMAVEGSLVKKQPISTVGDSMALNLHLAESERPYKAQDTEKSVDDNSVILLEQERTVINLETSSSEEQVQEVMVQDSGLGETSQQLALHYTQSQNDPSLIGKVHAPSQGRTSQHRDTQLSATGFKLSVPTERNLESSSNTGEKAKVNSSQQQTQSKGSAYAKEPVLTTDPVMPQPSLTLDMINTMNEEDSEQLTTAFTLFRPTVSPRADLEQSEKVTVFTKVKDRTPKKNSGSGAVGESTAPPRAGSVASVREGVQSENAVRFDSQEDDSAKIRQLIRDNQTQEDSQVYRKGRKKRAKVLAESQDDQSNEVHTTAPSASQKVKQDHNNTITGESYQQTKECKISEKARFKSLLGQATLEDEMDSDNTQEYEYSGKKGGAGCDETVMRGSRDHSDDKVARGRGRGRGRGRKGSRGRSKGKHEGNSMDRGIVEGDSGGQLNREDNEKRPTEEKVMINRQKGHQNDQEQMEVEGTNSDGKTEIYKGKAELKGQEVSQGKVCKNGGSEDNKGHSGRGRGRGGQKKSKGQGYPASERPGQGHTESNGENLLQREGEISDSPKEMQDLGYKILKYKGETPRAWREKTENKHINISSSKKSEVSKGQEKVRGSPASETGAMQVDAGPSKAPEMRQSLKISLVKQPTLKKTRKGKKFATSKKAKSPPNQEPDQSPANSSDTARQADISRLTPSSTAAKNTSVSELEHKTQSVQKTEVLSETIEHEEDVCETPSPSRTAQTLTSGDLGDISSFTDSHGRSKSSSTINTPHLGRSRSITSGRQSMTSSVRSLHKKSLSATSIAKSLGEKTSESTSGGSLERRKSVGDVGVSGRRLSKGLSREGEPSLVQNTRQAGSIGNSVTKGNMAENSETSDFPLAQVARTVDTLSDTSKRTSEEHTGLGGIEGIMVMGKGKFKRQGSSSGRGKQQQVRLKEGGMESASLFSTSDGAEAQVTTGKSRKKLNSGKNSESLFSAPASEADTLLLSNSDNVFVRPTTVPPGGKRYSSDSSRKSVGGQSTTESEVIPPTDTEKVHTKKNSPYISTIVDATHVSQTGPASSGEKSETDIVYLPPYRPTEPLNKGTKVMAMWKDKHYYPGIVEEVTTEKSRQLYLVQFDDGNQRKVKDTEIIVCDLLAVGQECMAITNAETGWSEVCIVVSHHRKGTESHCIVQFDDRRHGKIQRNNLCLSPDQAKHLITAIVSLPSQQEVDVPGIGSDMDIIPPTVQEVEGTVATGTEKEGPRQKVKGGKVSEGRGVGRKKGIVTGEHIEVKEDASGAESEKAVEEEYFPEEARTATTSGPLHNGTPVFAQWRDKCFYPGFVKEMDKKTLGRLVVRFEDGDERSVHEDDLIVCELLPVGTNVLVRREDAEWSEPAVILSHWKRAEVKGYKVKFEDQSQGKVGRGAVNLSTEQASTFLKEYLRPYSTPRPRLGDLSLENVVGGKRECSASSTSSAKAKPAPKTPPKKRGPQPKSVAPLKAEVDEQYFPEEARTAPTAGPLHNGTPVFAQWRDKCFYPGFVKESDKKTPGRLVVRFEDGDERSVHEDDLIVCELLPVGTNVLVQREGDWSEPARILSHWKRAEVKGYEVEFVDHSQGKVGRGAVNLSSDQASTFLTEFLRPHSTPRPRLGDLSLENVVGGKRERNVTTTPSTGVKVSTKSPAKKRGSQSRGGISETQSTGGKKRKLGVIEPKYTSTPTPKRQVARIQEGEESGVLSPVDALLDSPIQRKRTPMKSKHELFSSIKGPIPAPGSTLFQGYVCMLTHVDKTEDQKQREKPPELSTTDESIEVEQEEVPFDKDHLTKQIEGGGGVVVETFTEKHLATGHCIVLSDSHQRTLKYLQAIALGKPCVSHIWVKDSCLTESVQDFKSYALPSGFCLETGRILEIPEGAQPLRNCRIMVSSDNSRFTSTWEVIVEASGAKLCHSLPNTSKDAKTDPVLAVVADAYITPSILRQAMELDIPVVSSEWLVQSLISGRIKGFKAHPKYNYTATKP